MKKRFLFFVSYFLSLHSHSQNLVPNPSFEIITSCPGSTLSSQIHKAYPWFRVTSGTADIFNICASGTQSGMPSNAVGDQTPRTGNGYAGIITKTQTNNTREYIEVKLTDSLKANKKYSVSFYVSLADTCQWSTSSIGAYLSKDSVLKDTVLGSSNLTGYIPQIQNPSNKFLLDKQGWMPVSGLYTAQGGEKFISIGNFKDDSNTGTVTVIGTEPWSYYYIDDVSVIEISEVSNCTGNLLTNGSLISAEGENITAHGWTGGGTPDVNDANGAFNVSGYEWTGTPLASPDGGTWQNIMSTETISQTVYVIPCKAYTLRFQYAAQGIRGIGSLPPYNNNPVGAKVFLNGILAYTTVDDTTQYTWESASYNFIATTSMLTIKLMATQYEYLGIDGICLIPSASVALNLGKDTTICQGKTLTLDATTPGASYRWQDNSANPVYSVTQAGMYWVQIVMSCDTLTDSIKVNLADCNTSNMLIPNIFTPNYDGVNDVFRAQCLNIQNLNGKIYNRFGVKIFEWNGWDGFWDGRTGAGVACPQGTYYYVITAMGKDGNNFEEKGFLQLIR